MLMRAIPKPKRKSPTIVGVYLVMSDNLPECLLIFLSGNWPEEIAGSGKKSRPKEDAESRSEHEEHSSDEKCE
jgi:hypothetical protein